MGSIFRSPFCFDTSKLLPLIVLLNFQSKEIIVTFSWSKNFCSSLFSIVSQSRSPCDGSREGGGVDSSSYSPGNGVGSSYSPGDGVGSS